MPDWTEFESEGVGVVLRAGVFWRQGGGGLARGAPLVEVADFCEATDSRVSPSTASIEEQRYMMRNVYSWWNLLTKEKRRKGK